ncbi:unnamed protein product [Paramecium pentaurelia]|uniref:NACHT domain-containing protein n=1 Tax=Paramecium pentaurelia TaxID=43138 RepID=A0A8S1VCB6_9CILI|nr:unnamed protein product [Paramecium pentaurelia]
MQIWKEYLKRGFLIQMNHSNDQALTLLNQFKNNELTQIDKLILEETFKGWENLMVLKDFLLNEKNDNIHFTLALIQNQNQNQKAWNAKKINLPRLFAKFNNFLITQFQINQLLQFKRMMRGCESQFTIIRILSKKIKQATNNSQLKKMVFNFKEYFQETLKIIKIIKLSKRKQNVQIKQLEQKKINEFNLYQQLKYIMRLLEQIISQAIQDIKDNRNEPDESIMIQQELVLIQKALQNLNLTDQQFSFAQEFKQKILVLSNASLSQNNFLKEAQCMLTLIQQTEKQVSKLEMFFLQKGNLIQYCQSLLNNLNQHYEHQIQELQKCFNEFLGSFKTVLILKNEIESAFEPEKFKEIKQQYSRKLLFFFMKKQRLNILKLKLQLIAFQECFKNILTIPSGEFQQLQDAINLDEYLLDVIKDYPKTIKCCDDSLQDQPIAELTNLQITEQDYQNQLSKQKGIIEYIIFILSLEEQMIDSQSIDLELIENQFGQLFKEESCSFTLTERIMRIIENASIDNSIRTVTNENFNQSELNIEKEKYENLWQQLRIFENSIKKFIGLKFKNLKIPFTELLKELKNLKIEFLETNKKKLNFINKQQYQNDQILVSEKNDILENQFDYCEQKNIQTQCDEKYAKYLQNITTVLKSKIKKDKQQLCQLLEETQQFSNKLHLIQKYNKIIQANTYNKFHSYFQKQIQIFEKQQVTTDNLQQLEKESFQDYFKRIEINILQVKNEKDDKPIQQQTNICNFLNKAMGEIKLQLIQTKCMSSKIQFGQEYLIRQIKKIYLWENLEEEVNDIESNQPLELFQSLNQKYKDYKNNDQWKIKQGLVFTIIQISQNCFTETIIQFCQQALIQLWVLEKDQRVRNLLKNQNLISLQMQILQKDWKTQNDRIAGEMQQMLSRIDFLQVQISQEANMKQLNNQVNSEMGQQLKLITDFVNHIRKGLFRVEGKINEMKKQLNSLSNDIKFLMGKSVEELFDIRKSKVLKEAAQKNVRSIYVPLKTLEIFHQLEEGEKNKQKSILMNLENLYDKKGKVNEFLLDDKEEVLLIHGVAGSGKSTAAKKIEEFIWKLYDNNQKIGNKLLILIYISLPSLKNPVFQAVEEALHQNQYGVDELQLKECKEMLEKKDFRFLLIMDSYGEMKLENIQKNLYINNKLKQNWSNPLVIFTTRSEIFQSSNYSQWFESEDKNKLKEVQLQKFDSKQMQEYLEKFTIQSVKMLIFEIFEWQTQILNQGTIDINKFEICWEKLKQFLKKEISGLQKEKQINLIQSFLKNDEFLSLKSYDALRSLSINFQKLWSAEKYNKMMRQINLNKLVVTPYMMEVVVQVLPQMIFKATEVNNLKQNFIKNFSHALKEFYKSQYLIKMYHQKQKKLVAFQIGYENSQKVDYDEKLEVILKKIKFCSCIFRIIFFFKFEKVNLQLESQYMYNCVSLLPISIYFVPKQKIYASLKFKLQQKLFGIRYLLKNFKD